MNDAGHPTLRRGSPAEAVTARRAKCAKCLWLGGILVLAGIVLGCGSTILYFRSVYFSNIHKPESVVQEMEARLARQFALTPEEKKAIDESIRRNVGIMEDSRKRYNENTRKELLNWRGETYSILGKERAEAWIREIHRQMGSAIILPLSDDKGLPKCIFPAEPDVPPKEG